MGSARGVLVAAATRLGVDPVEYAHRIVLGEKWCIDCKTWHDIDAFGADASRRDGRAAGCRDAKNQRARERYIAKEPRPTAFRVEARPGDKKQARRRVNYLVEKGDWPDPNTVPCVDCGHRWKAGERRHEHDHHRGYDADRQLTVEVVCSACHHRRERART